MSDFERVEDPQAFVGERWGYWFKLAFRVLENRQEAEDTVQETLALIWERRGALSLKDPGAYVARAVWLNALKRRSRRKASLPLEVLEGEPGRPAPEGPWEGLSSAVLEEALGRLPESQRVVVDMKYQLGLSFRQIGQNLSISMNTAASRCRYALAALKKSLEAFRDHPDGP